MALDEQWLDGFSKQFWGTLVPLQKNKQTKQTVTPPPRLFSSGKQIYFLLTISARDDLAILANLKVTYYASFLQITLVHWCINEMFVIWFGQRKKQTNKNKQGLSTVRSKQTNFTALLKIVGFSSKLQCATMNIAHKLTIFCTASLLLG